MRFEKHHEGEDINRRGLFGNQFSDYEGRKRKKQKRAIKEAEEAAAVITLVSNRCWECYRAFETGVATDGYCPECLIDWAAESSSDLEKQKRIDEEKAAAKKKAEEKATKKIKKAEEKATKKKAEEKAAKKIKKAEEKATKKKAEADEAKLLQQSNHDVDETPAETDRQKPAGFEIGQVVQGCWEVDEESNAWEFGIVKSILWDLDPPNLGDPQWAYCI